MLAAPTWELSGAGCSCTWVPVCVMCVGHCAHYGSPLSGLLRGWLLPKAPSSPWGVWPPPPPGRSLKEERGWTSPWAWLCSPVFLLGAGAAEAPAWTQPHCTLGAAGKAWMKVAVLTEIKQNPHQGQFTAPVSGCPGSRMESWPRSPASRPPCGGPRGGGTRGGSPQGGRLAPHDLSPGFTHCRRPLVLLRPPVGPDRCAPPQDPHQVGEETLRLLLWPHGSRRGASSGGQWGQEGPEDGWGA